MTKFEFIQEAALRLLGMQTEATDFTCKAVASAAKKLADEVWEYEMEDQIAPQHVLEQMGIAEEPENPRNDYAELKDEVENWRYIHLNQVSPVMEALTKNVKSVSLTCAKGLSQFYGRFNKDIIKDAIDNGEIAGVIPETRQIQLTRWDATLRQHVPDKIRQQRVGSYEVDRLSLFQWLESHYTRRTAKGTLIDKYIEKIINGK